MPPPGERPGESQPPTEKSVADQQSWARNSPKESMQPRRRVRPPTARELDPARGDVASAARPGYDGMLAWVRGRHDTGAPLPVMQPGPSKAAALGYALVPRPPAPPEPTASPILT